MEEKSSNRESQWQGFQQFHDASQSKKDELNEIKSNNTSWNKQENLYNVSPQKTVGKQRNSQRKKSDAKIQVTNEQQKGFKLPNSSSVRPTQQRTIPKIQPKRYERIPIIRYEEDCRYSGRVIYKNFVPRTSDNYIRILKEVDWDQAMDKKRDVRNLHGIEFNSQFQSGNLNLAIQLQYDLYMRVDSNTNGHRQWFYFSMKNQKKCRVKLHIFRFKKQYSLFQRGMRPYLKSRKQGKNWKPGGQNIVYHYQRQRNDYGVNKEVKNFVLTFNYTFQHENDEVFVAAGIPYSYSFLQKQLIFYKEEAQKRQGLNFQITNLGKSMCGLDLPLITIEHKMSKLIHKQRKKRYIIINTRTHSGETSSSWVLDGFLQEVGQCKEFQNWILAENICLKIVTMLNPDGVFIGNYRTGIIGDDFNRKFNSGKKQFYPQIFALKRLISQCKKQGLVQLFLDLHGHSILKNSFIYGPSQDFSSKFSMKGLPYHLFHNSKYFRFASCKFKTEKENIQTARIYFQLKEEILTFTSQTSLGLYYSQCQTFQMLSEDYQNFGKSVLHSMMDTSIKRDIKMPQQNYPRPSQKHKTTKPIKDSNQKKTQTKLKISTPKSMNKNKVSLRLPTANKNNFNAEQLQINEGNFSFSQQINRQDQISHSIHFSQNEKSSKQQSRNQKRPVNFRRRSQIMKVPKSNLLQRIINKHKVQQFQRKSSEQEGNWLGLGRSATYDTSETLKRQIDHANKNQEESEIYQQYQMEPIDQNFSEDYLSMNDLDSQGQNLPDQQRNYLFQYIKSNQHHIQAEDELGLLPRNEEKQQKLPNSDSKEPRVSRFRQVRFKSIQQTYQCESNSKEPPRISIKKIKLQPHKFKDNVSKSLIYKYHQIVPHVELDDTNLITFSQQKRLNQRSQLHRTQKDPFILFQRKQKFFDKQ